MQGHEHLSNVLNCYVLEKYGEEAALNVKARLSKLIDVESNINWLNLTAEIVEGCLDESKEDILENLGVSYIQQMLNTSEYRKLILSFGINFIDFFNNLDYLHDYIAHKTKLNLHHPSFRCVEGLGGSMELFFIAQKCCYSQHLAAGIIKGISNLVFQSPITCTLRKEGVICLHSPDQNKSMMEATYDLNLQAIKNEVDPLIVPLMLAQTNKNAEKKISRSNVEEVNEEIAHILLTEGPEGHPLRKAARQKARMRWKKLGDVIRGAAFFKYLASQFQPIVPKDIDMNARDFCCLMPFHVMIDKESNILHAGLAIQRQVPALKNFGDPLSVAMKCLYPMDINLTYDVIFSVINTTFILHGEYHRKDRQSYFKGHFIVMNQPRRLLFVGSPYVRTIDDCNDAGLKFSQLSLYDVTRELILMNIPNPHSSDLFATTTIRTKLAQPDGACVSTQTKISSLEQELAEAKNQLAQTNAQLAALKNRYKRLYLGLVPLSVVSNLQEQTQRALLPTEKAMVDLTPEDDIDSELLSYVQAASSSPNKNVTGVGGNTVAGDVHLEKANFNTLHVQTPSQQIMNQRSISVDRGRLMKIQDRKRGNGKPLYQPNYMEYDGVCMMFCDVVEFTEQADMDTALRNLTTAYTWLSRLCQVFHLEIVESVGDGFLVISHVTGRTKHQAARNMADCALAYLILNKEQFPSLRLRVGIHIGKIYGGVIERIQKTFIVWGSDVEFTCKMESFGLPGKIQVSHEFFSYINDGSFNFEAREVSLRGHEPTTYLLLTSSKIWSDSDLQEIFGESMGL